VIAAFSTFRMVRRRRFVWFRAPYGSKAYKRDEQRRRHSVRETDRNTLLGRILQHRRQFLARQVQKRLRRAQTMFEKRQERYHSKRQHSDDIVASTSSEEEDDSFATPRELPGLLSAPTPQRMKRRPSFATNPTEKMESVMHDQIFFPDGRINNMPYAHGGFFGAAPFMLANPHWISILRHLMPDVYVEISRRVAYAPRAKLIHWAENNPVMAAYGTAHELEFHGCAPNLEWDVFLDPSCVAAVELVLFERDKFFASIAPGASPDKPLSSLKSLNLDLSESQEHIATYYNKELKQRTQALVNQMLIAHGRLTQLALEQTGWVKRYNYSRMKRIRSTLGGGIFAQQWLALYAESLRFGICDHGDLRIADRDSTDGLAFIGTTSLDELAEANCPVASIKDSVSLAKSIMKCDEAVGLVLDLKSRHVSKRVWACVVDTLRDAGVRVEGIASFTIEEIRDISCYCSTPVKEVIFFHTAGDLQQACHSGRIRNGDSVFFNAGSLLWNGSQAFSREVCRLFFDPEDYKRGYRILPYGRTKEMDDQPGEKSHSLSTIEQYKVRYHLSLGLYCQEFAIDDAAVSLMVRYVNRNPQVYDLGLSWGGVNGVTIRGIQPGRFTNTDGLWTQRYAGASWDYELVPPP
jgi:hypothetical protein